MSNENWRWNGEYKDVSSFNNIMDFYHRQLHLCFLLSMQKQKEKRDRLPTGRFNPPPIFRILHLPHFLALHRHCFQRDYIQQCDPREFFPFLSMFFQSIILNYERETHPIVSNLHRCTPYPILCPGLVNNSAFLYATTSFVSETFTGPISKKAV